MRDSESVECPVRVMFILLLTRKELAMILKLILSRNKSFQQCHARKFSLVSTKMQKQSNSSFSFTVQEFSHPPSNFSISENQTAISEPEQAANERIIPVNNSKRNDTSERRFNELNVQMLSASLYRQIFGNDRSQPPDLSSVQKAIEELKKFGLWKEVETLPDVSLNLPRLEGKNLEEHFWNIGEQQSGSYKAPLLDFVKRKLPSPPAVWLCAEGWTCYAEGCEPEPVPFPDENILVFDVEVCCKIGAAPTLATAVGDTAWYGWVSKSLLSSADPVHTTRYTPDMLIPLEGKGIDKNRPRVVVGHNVSYDRARVREQYRIDSSALRFVDTMSMHICIGGVTSYQRAMLKTQGVEEDDEWRQYSSLNSLKEVYKLYCKEELSKEKRNLFVEGSLSEIREEFQDVMKYCASDVTATFKVLQKMVPMFFHRFPHPVTFAGMLEMGTAYLPINSNWERYMADSDQTYEDLEKECKFMLTRKADNACHLFHEEKYRQDLWMWDEDWSTQELKMTKKKIKPVEKIEEKNRSEVDDEENLEENFHHLFDSAAKLPVRKPNLPGYPLWYRKLCDKPGGEDWVPGPQLISTGVKVTPKLLNLTWEGYPLHYTRQYGWGILVADLNAQVQDPSIPFEKLKELTKVKGDVVSEKTRGSVENLHKKVDESFAKEDYWKKKGNEGTKKGRGVWCDHIVEDCCHFLKLPHKDGPENNVGNPLAKDFIKTFSNSVLAAADAAAAKVLAIGAMVSYWRNNRERITQQLAVWRDSGLGAILPQVVVCGTLTRRAMEPTWMTASNAIKDRVGSELRSMVQAPPGYHLVGADVDSQELWIASVIGDAAYARLHGATPFGWMTLSGSKANGTDMHSVTAGATGISRDHAKVINYARIYGAGVRFAQRLLQQFNPEMSDTEAKSKANKMFLLTKGRRVFHLKSKYKDHLPAIEVPEVHSSFSAKRLAKALGKSINEVFEPPVWEGGSESAMFNRLEQVACAPQPKTPFLSARLSRAIEPRSVDDDAFLTTRVNWVVQSGAADFLHLMLVSLRWLSQGKMRFCLSFHDEVRYLVPSHLRYEAALALHITNLLTRAFCAHRLGLHDLPQSVAFFASVEVDTVIRKEARDDCKTPSNPHGLEKGYGIPPGESLDIYETLKKCEGSLAGLRKKPR